MYMDTFGHTNIVSEDNLGQVYAMWIHAICFMDIPNAHRNISRSPSLDNKLDVYMHHRWP